MAKRIQNEVVYKFVIWQLRKAVTAPNGTAKYIESADSIIYDLFGVKRYVGKLSEAYDNKEIVAVMSRIDINDMMKLVQSSKNYKIFKEMIHLNARLVQLTRILKKKNKRTKDTVSEYKYLSKLYGKSMKYLRNSMGIKKYKKDYKRKFDSLKNMVSRSGYDDDDMSAFLMDFDDDFGRKSYEPEMDEFDDFEESIKSRQRSRFDDLDDDDDDDDEYSIFNDIERKAHKEEQYEKDARIDRLEDAVMNMASHVEALVNYNQHQMNTDYNNRYSVEQEIQTPHQSTVHNPKAIAPKDMNIDKITSALENLADNQYTMEDQFNQLLKKVNKLGEFVATEYADRVGFDDDDDDDGIIIRNRDDDDENPPTNSQSVMRELQKDWGEEDENDCERFTPEMAEIGRMALEINRKKAAETKATPGTVEETIQEVNKMSTQSKDSSTKVEKTKVEKL